MHQAHAYIALEIAKISRSPTPAADRSFVMGMIEMAAALGCLPFGDAESYREALAIKPGNRIVAIRRAA